MTAQLNIITSMLSWRPTRFQELSHGIARAARTVNGKALNKDPPKGASLFASYEFTHSSSRHLVGAPACRETSPAQRITPVLYKKVEDV